jgi:Zn-dependent protease
MAPARQGSIRLFRFAGIDVYLHWSWFIVALYMITERGVGRYSSLAWNALEYLALFCIVLIHEFGHQLACRSVGGQTHNIVLWPLGGVAFVTPPQRPGAQLWSIAAGPMVNVVLVPVLTVFLFLLGGHPSLHGIEPNEYAEFLNSVWLINLALLVFNMLPIYPLDGGQILRSLLWFVLGRANSLLIASIIGFIGVGGLLLLAGLSYLIYRDKVQALWLGAICVFMLLNCWSGLMHGMALARIARAPRREGFACPSCGAAPPVGAFWVCGRCRKPFDMFATQAVCPLCGAQFGGTACLDCHTMHLFSDWMRFPPPPPIA